MRRTKKSLRGPFTDLEHAVMSIVWRHGSVTADQVRRDLARKHDLRESTVRTLLRRLEEKGHLTHKVEGRTYLYSSVDEPQSFAIRAVRQIIDRFCAGSAEQLIVGMVDNKMVDSEQLRTLAEDIENKSSGSST
jgi:BlaI family transcriptional regulator, penicillinase repressor